MEKHFLFVEEDIKCVMSSQNRWEWINHAPTTITDHSSLYCNPPNIEFADTRLSISDSSCQNHKSKNNQNKDIHKVLVEGYKEALKYGRLDYGNIKHYEEEWREATRMLNYHRVDVAQLRGMDSDVLDRILADNPNIFFGTRLRVKLAIGLGLSALENSESESVEIDMEMNK